MVPISLPSQVSSSDSSKMPDWKTYKSIKNHFSVAYPPDWNLEEIRFDQFNKEINVFLTDKFKNSSINFMELLQGRGCQYMGEGPTPIITKRIFYLGSESIEVEDNCFKGNYRIKTLNNENKEIYIEFGINPTNLTTINQILKSIEGLKISKS